MDDIIVYVASWILAALAVVAILFGFGYLDARQKCENMAMKMNYQYTYAADEGCMIKVEENKWIPLDSYIYIGNKDTK